ncbi:MAG: hypothetical protein DMG10_17385, partial [Acidobacteria bacterium]
DVEGLAKRFFSANEFQVLHSLRAGQRTDAFFRGWTRKEAYLKARGEAPVIRIGSRGGQSGSR